MLRSLQAIFQGLDHWRAGRAWLAVPLIGLGLFGVLYSCVARVEDNRRASEIYRAMPETYAGWTLQESSSKEEGEGKTQFTRRFAKPGKTLRVSLKPGTVFMKTTDEEYLREVSDKPGRGRAIERVAGHPVYLDRFNPSVLAANAVIGNRAIVTFVVIAQTGHEPQYNDVLDYLRSMDYPAIIGSGDRR